MTPDLSPAAALEHLARRSPTAVSVIADDGTETTARALHDGTVALAGLLAADGVTSGDRVAYAGRNSPAHLLTMLACAHLGAVFVPLNFRLAEAEVRATLEHCAPHTVVVEPDLDALYARACAAAGVPRVLPSADAVHAASVLTAEQRDAAPERAQLDADTLAVIMYTSGSSGVPKGVMLTHGNLWWSGHNIDEVLDTRHDDVTLAVAPMFHIGGLNAFTLRTLARGGTVVLRRGFDAARTLHDLLNGVTTVFGVPAMYAAVSRAEGFAVADLSGVRVALVGGAPMPPSLLERFAARGLTIQQSWGMTETAPAATFMPLASVALKPASVGIALPYTRLRLVCPDTGDTVTDPGVVGELWVHGPHVTSGYWNNDAATAAALTADGWLRTGDLAVQDADGYLTLVGRRSEMINTGGEKVAPGEVEAALSGLEGVSEVVVVGAPDAAWGETVVAVLECPDGQGPTLDAVRDLGQRTIARFKLPTRVLTLAELPRTATGKVDRCAVRALAAST